VAIAFGQQVTDRGELGCVPDGQQILDPERLGGENGEDSSMGGSRGLSRKAGFQLTQEAPDQLVASP
jgi:hypothetical protein